MELIKDSDFRSNILMTQQKETRKTDLKYHFGGSPI